MKERVFLVGFMGCGKSAVGRSLADMLAWRFLDTDSLVEESEGKSIKSIFDDHGEEYFREAERRALRSAVEMRQVVVATGGGLFTGEPERRLMQDNGVTVWLEVTLEKARKRVGEGRSRPLWNNAGRDYLEGLYRERNAVYAAADHRIRADDGSPEVIAERIIVETGLSSAGRR
jgi:shikimate kinase